MNLCEKDFIHRTFISTIEGNKNNIIPVLLFTYVNSIELLMTDMGVTCMQMKASQSQWRKKSSFRETEGGGRETEELSRSSRSNI